MAVVANRTFPIFLLQDNLIIVIYRMLKSATEYVVEPTEEK